MEENNFIAPTNETFPRKHKNCYCIRRNAQKKLETKETMKTEREYKHLKCWHEWMLAIFKDQRRFNPKIKRFAIYFFDEDLFRIEFHSLYHCLRVTLDWIKGECYQLNKSWWYLRIYKLEMGNAYLSSLYFQFHMIFTCSFPILSFLPTISIASISHLLSGVQ